MAKFRLVGGSAGRKFESNETSEFSKMPQINMFKPKGLFPTVLKEKANVTGFILPSFDSSLSEYDQSRVSSWEAYRDASSFDQSTGLNEFTSWFIPLGTLDDTGKYVTKGGIYQYFGNSKSTFISPSLIPGQSDPIMDLRIHIFKKRKEGDTTYIHLTERPKYNAANPKETAVWALPSTKMAYLINAYCTGSNQYDDDHTKMMNRILMLNSAAFDELIKDLDAYRPGNMTSIDPNWPDFMFGDITNPERAIKFTSQAAKTNISFTKMCLGTYDRRTGLSYVTEDLTTHPEILAGRYDLTDTDNLIHIPTYDEVVNQLVIEGTVPYNLIAEVCGKKCERMPENPENTNVDEYEASAPTVANNATTEEEDEIPGIKEAPVWTPPVQKEPVVQPTIEVKQEFKPAPVAPVAPKSDSPLTAEEEEEFKALFKRMQDTKGVGMAVQEITRYSELYGKAGAYATTLMSSVN